MSWKGVKKQSNIENIKTWCDEVGIQNYTITPHGEIDVDGNVSFTNCNIKELPYKFGKVNKLFSLSGCKNLKSLKNCPHTTYSFSCSNCSQLDSLEGCPTKVGGDFFCYGCKRSFSKEEIKSLCKVKMDIYL